MNILITCSANRWGGNEKWGFSAYKELSKNHNVHYCYSHDELGNKVGSIQKHQLPFRGYFDIETYQKLAQIIEDEKIQVLLPTKRQDWVVCGLLAKKYGIKNVIRLGIVRYPWVPVWHWVVYGYLCDGIIVNARQIKKGLRFFPYINQKKVQVIYNGIPVIPKVTKELSSDVFLITSVGTVTKRKGFHLLLQAVSLLPVQLKKKIRVEIIGDGPYLEELKELTNTLGLINQTTFPGFCSDVLDRVKNSHLFVLLSSNEGISNAILEAMMCEVPVWVSAVGGHAEFIKNKENGFITTTLSPSRLNSQLGEILNFEDLKGLGEKGRTTVEAIFSLERMGKQIESYFNSLV